MKRRACVLGVLVVVVLTLFAAQATDAFASTVVEDFEGSTPYSNFWAVCTNGSTGAQSMCPLGTAEVVTGGSPTTPGNSLRLREASGGVWSIVSVHFWVPANSSPIVSARIQTTTTVTGSHSNSWTANYWQSGSGGCAQTRVGFVPSLSEGTSVGGPAYDTGWQTNLAGSQACNVAREMAVDFVFSCGCGDAGPHQDVSFYVDDITNVDSTCGGTTGSCGSDAPPTGGTPASSTCSTVYDAGQVVEVAREVGFANVAGQSSGNGLRYAVAVAFAESGGNVAAVGGPNFDGSFDYGLWQINGTAHPTYDPVRLLSEAAYNARAAWDISGGGTNFGPWTTYNTGAYAGHLAQADAAIAGAAPTGPLPCLGSQQGAGEYQSTATGDKSDGGSGCGFDWNFVHSLGCVLQWAFVPSSQSTDFTVESNHIAGTAPGQFVSQIQGAVAAVEDAGTDPGGGGGSVRVFGTDYLLFDQDAAPSAIRMGVGKFIEFMMWMGVGYRIVRTLPWNERRESVEPVA